MTTKSKAHDTVVALAPPAPPLSAPAAPAPTSAASAQAYAAVPPAAPSKRRLLRVDEVEERVRISRTSIYRGMRKHEFPQCIKMAGSSFWIESEIEAHIEALMSARPR